MMIGSIFSRRCWLILCLSIVVLALPSSVLSIARGWITFPSSLASPLILWQADSLDILLAPGETAVKQTTFTSNQALQNVSLKASPEIARFLKLKPFLVPNLPTNKRQQVLISFSIPDGTVLGIYQGTIQVKSGNQPLRGTLKVVINVTGPALNLDVRITSPSSGDVFNVQPITVAGVVNINLARVTVNGVPAGVSGGRFVANNVLLPRDGNNIITAIATGPGGSAAQSSITVALDTMPPTVVIDSPPNGFTTADETVAIAGMVSDVITVNPVVTVNGVRASVNNGTFIAMGVPLNPGANQITATARDGVGNVGAAAITVTRAAQPGLRLNVQSGQAQSGVVNTTLPEPLRIQLLDGNGDPTPNREVLFQVVRGDGTLKNSPPTSGQIAQRALNVRTDATGQVAVQFTLGSRTGAGNNRVHASVAGGLSFVEFCATATSGMPDRIAIIPMSNQQTGVVNRPLAEPFACVVLDAMGNPVAGVPVLFQVTEGGGNFGGSQTTTVTTGADGISRVLLTLGPEAGTQNNTVTAAYQGQTDPPIEFAASGRSPGPIANTTFSGLVLDNGDRPLRNARAVIFGTNRAAFTDATGRFTIANVPPGAQRLFIEGEPITDPQGRIFPDLEFDVNVISGVDNSLPMPIYLPPLATEAKSIARVTGPVTTTIALQMPGVPEATLTLLPGTIVSDANGPASATNPITVRVSWVNTDRVPMPPPNGSVFMLAGTVQPAGTHFDPPAQVCVPNAGMPPGAQVDIFSFDHDVGQFLSVGLATVSEDGATLCSNPGFGIRKAGWYGCTPPPPPGTEVKNCQAMRIDAEAINQDNPTNITFAPLLEGSPVYGGSENSTSDNLKLKLNFDLSQGPVPQKTTWSVTGPGSASYIPPLPSATATEWNVGEIKAQAGRPTFEVIVDFAQGGTCRKSRDIEVGIRTDDVIVIGWIDRKRVPLPDGASSSITEILPREGSPNAVNCIRLIGDLSINDTSPLSLNLIPVDRSYILHWMFKNTYNEDPSDVIPGSNFRDSSDTHIDETKVRNFVETRTNYKLFNRLQVKFKVGANGFNGLPVRLKGPTAEVGDTKNPCANFPSVFGGQRGFLNGALTFSLDRISLINDGSPDDAGIRAFNTLTGKDLPLGQTPVFWENIGSQIRFTSNMGTTPTVILQPYPTYYVYRNGKLDKFLSVEQPLSPLKNFLADPYPFGTVSCPGLRGTTPGGRCGNAVLPADESARTPPYIVR